jgi:Domain of unknown function (DUF1707)
MLSHRLRAALRPSDAERERAIAALKIQYAEGRLSTEELEARITDVYSSGTRGQLALYLRDLPLRGARTLITRRVRRVQRAVLRMHILTFVGVNASIVAVWALTGQGSFWPALLLIPSAVLLGWHIAASRTLTRAMNRHNW